MTTAVRRGWHTSARVKGMSSPNACSTLPNLPGDSSRPIVGFVCVHLRIEQNFEGQRHLDRDEEPLDESRLGQGEIIGVALCRLDAIQLEHDHDTKLVRACVIFAYDARLPQAPHIGD